MTFDLYQPCPGGLGKKIKFCCRDLAHELDKISRLVQADQDKAAMDYVERLVRKYPERPCVLAWHSRLKIALAPVVEARAAVEQFLAAAPDNPMAHCSMAVVEVRTPGMEEDEESAEAPANTSPYACGRPPEHTRVTDSCRRAIDALQRTMECITNAVPGHLANTFVLVGRRLLMEGFPMAGREHLRYAVYLQKGKNSQPLGQIDLINSYRHTDYPLLLKDAIIPPRPPAHAAWRGDFFAADRDIARGRWRAALRRLLETDARYPKEPVLHWMLVKLHIALAENIEAAQRLRALAQLDGVPESDAAYAIALSVLLDVGKDTPLAEEVRMEFPIHDVDKVTALLEASPRVVRRDVSLAEFADEQDLVPRAMYLFFDRALPSQGDEIRPEDLAVVVAQAFVYGEHGDRSARLEVDMQAGPYDDAVQETLAQLEGSVDAQPTRLETIEWRPFNLAYLATEWHGPVDLPVDRDEELRALRQQHLLLHEWPELPQALLDGKSLREAAPDPAYRTRVLALLLIAESANLNWLEIEHFDELYRSLGLPVPQPRSIFADDLARTTTARLARVDPTPLSDAALTAAFQNAVTNMCPRSMRRFGLEIIRRGTLQGQPVSLDHIYATLAKDSPFLRDAVHWLQKAQEAARKAGNSPAEYLIQEVEMRILRRELDLAKDVYQRLLSLHRNEPGVANAVQRLLARHGMKPQDEPSFAAMTDSGWSLARRRSRTRAAMSTAQRPEPTMGEPTIAEPSMAEPFPSEQTSDISATDQP